MEVRMAAYDASKSLEEQLVLESKENDQVFFNGKYRRRDTVYYRPLNCGKGVASIRKETITFTMQNNEPISDSVTYSLILDKTKKVKVKKDEGKHESEQNEARSIQMFRYLPWKRLNDIVRRSMGSG